MSYLTMFWFALVFWMFGVCLFVNWMFGGLSVMQLKMLREVVKTIALAKTAEVTIETEDE